MRLLWPAMASAVACTIVLDLGQAMAWPWREQNVLTSVGEFLRGYGELAAAKATDRGAK
jgi:hypothetical protein